MQNELNMGTELNMAGPAPTRKPEDREPAEEVDGPRPPDGGDPWNHDPRNYPWFTGERTITSISDGEGRPPMWEIVSLEGTSCIEIREAEHPAERRVVILSSAAGILGDILQRYARGGYRRQLDETEG